jgi:hypothetical protein
MQYRSKVYKSNYNYNLDVALYKMTYKNILLDLYVIVFSAAAENRIKIENRIKCPARRTF